MKTGRFLALVLLILFSGVTHAAQQGVVDSDDVELHQGPSKKSLGLAKVPKGTLVQASNEATEGFFKVRIPSGQIGWLPADALILKGVVGSPPMSSAPAPRGGVPRATQGAAASRPSRKEGPTERYPDFRFSLLGGFDLFSVGSVNSLFGFQGLKNGYGYGAEIVFPFRPDLGMIFRFEKLGKTVVGNETVSKQTYQFDLSSLPMMVGVDYRLFRQHAWTSHLDLLLGLGVSTHLNSTALAFTSDNVTTYAGSAIAGLLKFDLHYEFASHLTLMTELGYRYVKTAALTPTLATNGGDIFKDTSQVPLNLVLDMSGIVFDFGVGISF